MERAEINNDLSRSEPIREVRQTKDSRTSEATKKAFVAELERRLPGDKRKKKKDEKDEIILREEDSGDESGKGKRGKKKDGDDRKKNKPVPPVGPEGERIDLIA